MNLLIAPHCDDVALFAAFTAIKEKPLVLVCFDGYVQRARGARVTPQQRRTEEALAADILGVEVQFLGLRDDEPDPQMLREALRQFRSARVWCPALEERGHAQHNMVAAACESVFSPGMIQERYLTYTEHGKSVSSRPVSAQTWFRPSWILQKLRAMAAHESQVENVELGCWPHFLRPIEEFYA